MTDSPPTIIDCASLAASELPMRLGGLDEDASVLLTGFPAAAPWAGLCSGLAHPITVAIEGDVGDFCYLLGNQATLEIRGHAGDCLAHSLVGGQITVQGNAGRCAAAFAQGGFVAVLGQAGEQCGVGLSGGDLLVRSRSGDRAGQDMRSGTLVLGNGTGHELGHGMTGGVIFVRGEVKSKSPHVRMDRLKDADALRLSLLLARAGIKAQSSEFKLFRVKGSAA